MVPDRRRARLLALAAILAICDRSAPAGDVASTAAGEAPAAGVALPEAATATWWTAASERIGRIEYHASPLDGGRRFSAPNRTHDLRVTFDENGIRVVPRAGNAAWEWGLRLAAIGREGGALLAVPPGALAASGNRVEIARTIAAGAASAPFHLVEWYVNGPDGLEQGFAIDARPGDAENGTRLVLEMEVAGSLAGTLAADRRSLEFAHASANGGATTVLRHDHLFAFDADGAPLAARFALDGDRLRILVDDANARYPIVVDPLTTKASWTAAAKHEFAEYGFAVATAGDVNADGFADVLVGANFFDDGHDKEGRAFLYLGGTKGLSPVEAWTYDGVQDKALLSHSLATAGDVNGDGFADVVVGSPGYDAPLVDEGRAFVFHGGPQGLAPDFAWSAEGNQAGANFGRSVATAGDVNDDGFSDVLVSAWLLSMPENQEGVVFAYHGGPGGVAADPAWTAQGNQNGAALGSWVGTAGDVNADGFADVILGAWLIDDGEVDEGGAFVHHGGAAGLAPAPAWSAYSDHAGARYGLCVGTAGDVDGDGYADVIVGAPSLSQNLLHEGRADLHRGGPGGVAAVPSWSVRGKQPGASLGLAVGTAGDVDADGFADVVVGAFAYDAQTADDDGRVWLYRGGPDGPELTASWHADGAQIDGYFGFAAATAGDVNGDGFADVVVGAPIYDFGGENSGRAFLFLGSAAGLAADPGFAADGGAAGARFSAAVAGAGDVNGDGFADALVGAPDFDAGAGGEGRAFLFFGAEGGLAASPGWSATGAQAGARFGAAVSTAGDADGDGFGDVLIGAPGAHDETPGEGRAFLYLGGAAGPGAVPVWSARGNQHAAAFGAAAACAGDVNGDGLADLLVGAPRFDTFAPDTGRAFLFHGAAQGAPGASAAWTASGTTSFATFGSALAGAGDVDGDGLADVIAGAPGTAAVGGADAGRAALFRGTAVGLAGEPAWQKTGPPGARFGAAVASAGDVDGDGFAEIAVGEPGALLERGRVRVFGGGAAGATDEATWSAAGTQPGERFGAAVAAAGDVNGDGFADMAAGAPGFDGDVVDAGRASVFFGGAQGLDDAPAWTRDGEQAGGGFASVLAGAGDVDGDGFADVLIGAPDEAASDQASAGRARLFHGNEGPGRMLHARQRRALVDAPVEYRGLAPETAFRVALLGRTPFGRGRVQLEVEALPLGELFGGNAQPVVAHSDWFDTGTEGAPLDAVLADLPQGAWHWRARVRYDAATTPFQQASRWITQPSGGAEEADLRVRPALPVFVPGDTLAGALDGAGDFVEARFSGFDGLRLRVEFAKDDPGAPFAASVVLVDPFGVPEGFLAVAKKRATPVTKTFKLKETGAYTLRVLSTKDLAGAFTMTTSRKLPKSAGAAKKTLKAGKGPGAGKKTATFAFDALAGATLDAALQSSGGGGGFPLHVRVLGPSGAELDVSPLLDVGPGGAVALSMLPLAQTGQHVIEVSGFPAGKKAKKGAKVKLVATPAQPPPGEANVAME